MATRTSKRKAAQIAKEDALKAAQPMVTTKTTAPAKKAKVKATPTTTTPTTAAATTTTTTTTTPPAATAASKKAVPKKPVAKKAPPAVKKTSAPAKKTPTAKAAKKVPAPSPSPPPVASTTATTSAASPPPKMAKQTIKGGVAVAGQSGKEATYHVYQDKAGVSYNFLGNQTDLKDNKNKFYIIQMLEADAGGSWCVFTNWGRVGYSGQTEFLTSKGTKAALRTVDECIAAFTSKYKDKTGNNWEDRDNFIPKNKKYEPVAVRYTNEDEGKVDDNNKRKTKKAKTAGADIDEEVIPKIPDSTLAKPVQTLMQLIFDVKQFTDQVCEMRYDINKMPLGKLTEEQIDSGMQALKEIESCINNKKSTTEWCNTFYTRIPHDFGMRRPHPINSLNDVAEKQRLLETLSDIKLTMTMIKTATTALENPLDSNYNQLNSNIQPIAKKSKEFKIISDYMTNSHGSTHSSYTLSIEDAFKIERNGCNFDDATVSPDTTKLLWHGSRLSNWSSIIGQGLRIAPPSAPVTGYMFGKGVYFADSVSKSANYCFTDSTNNTGLLLLCEVVVGKENERLTTYDSDHTLHTKFKQNGKVSTFGVGVNMPDPKHDIVHDNVTVPVGKMIDTKRTNPSGGYTLAYNEYIVYDTKQIRPKYLIKTKFNYGSRW